MFKFDPKKKLENPELEENYYYLDLVELSNDYKKYFPYVDYIISVIKLYTNLCVSRNLHGMKSVMDIGFNYENIVHRVC